MFDVERLVSECREAIAEPEPRLAIRDVLERAVAEPEALADALPPTRAEIVKLHVSPDLSVLKVVWAPGMTLGPHDHRMWAAIGIYSGGENNRFFRRTGRELADAGGRSLRPRDVCLLGDDAVHSVTNPTGDFAGAIHVYGGDFVNQPRSQWGPGPREERPYDINQAMQQFTDANRAWQGASS